MFRSLVLLLALVVIFEETLVVGICADTLNRTPQLPRSGKGCLHLGMCVNTNWSLVWNLFKMWPFSLVNGCTRGSNKLK